MLPYSSFKMFSQKIEIKCILHVSDPVHTYFSRSRDPTPFIRDHPVHTWPSLLLLTRSHVTTSFTWQHPVHTWPHPIQTWPISSHMIILFSCEPPRSYMTSFTHDHLVHTTTPRSHMTIPLSHMATPRSNMPNQFTQQHPGSDVTLVQMLTNPFTQYHLHIWQSHSHDHIPYTRRRDHPINTWPPHGHLTYLHVAGWLSLWHNSLITISIFYDFLK